MSLIGKVKASLKQLLSSPRKEVHDKENKTTVPAKNPPQKLTNIGYLRLMEKRKAERLRREQQIRL
jgi:hypothetical protein